MLGDEVRVFCNAVVLDFGKRLGYLLMHKVVKNLFSLHFH